MWTLAQLVHTEGCPLSYGCMLVQNLLTYYVQMSMHERMLGHYSGMRFT